MGLWRRRSCYRLPALLCLVPLRLGRQQSCLIGTVRALSNMAPPSTKTTYEPLPIPLDKFRKVPNASVSDVLITAAAASVWSVTVLPMTLAYQAGKAVYQRLTGHQPPEYLPSQLDSGYQVDPQTVIPRAQRKYDIVILGATGYTGRLAARYLVEKMKEPSSEKISWAIAGRSQEKLDRVKSDLSAELGVDLSGIDTIIVDTSVPATMPALVRDARCVATTAGPYAMYGNSVVEFCAKFGAHYVDITGEVDWVRTMASTWHTTAQESGAKIVSFCGHDSIPWDLCTMKLTDALEKECQDELKSVTFWDVGNVVAPGGTFATLFANIEGRVPAPPKTKVDPFKILPDGSTSDYKTKVETQLIPQSTPQTPWKEFPWASFAVMSAVNGAVVRWSHALRQKGSKGMTYKEAQGQPSRATALVQSLQFYMTIGSMLNPVTAALIKRKLYKPGEGQSINKLKKNYFLCILGEGIGAQGNRSECMMFFNQDVGTYDTSRMLVEAGLALALEEDSLPAKKGGFWTPASSMGDVLLSRMQNNMDTQFNLQVIRKEQRSKL